MLSRILKIGLHLVEIKREMIDSVRDRSQVAVVMAVARANVLIQVEVEWQTHSEYVDLVDKSYPDKVYA